MPSFFMGRGETIKQTLSCICCMLLRGQLIFSLRYENPYRHMWDSIHRVGYMGMYSLVSHTVARSTAHCHSAKSKTMIK